MFILGGEMQGSSCREIAAFKEAQKQAFPARFLAHAPVIELTNGTDHIGSASTPSHDHRCRAGPGKQGMNMQQLIVGKMVGKPVVQAGADSKFP